MTQRTTHAQKFGMSGEANTAKSKVTAKTESQTLAAANPGRVCLYITNNGAKKVWLAYGATAVAEEGPYLAAETGTATIDNYSGIVTCITKEGESLVTFSEI